MKARQILTSEIALVHDIEIAEAERIVDGALKEGTK
jgi:RNA polymerase-interacting CarD/CdnL/TRCF family regulator